MSSSPTTPIASCRSRMGRVTVTAALVTIALPLGGRQETIRRDQVTRVETKPGPAAIFGWGGGLRIILYMQDGRRMDLGLCSPKSAARAVAVAIQAP